MYTQNMKSFPLIILLAIFLLVFSLCTPPASATDATGLNGSINGYTGTDASGTGYGNFGGKYWLVYYYGGGPYCGWANPFTSGCSCPTGYNVIYTDYGAVYSDWAFGATGSLPYMPQMGVDCTTMALNVRGNYVNTTNICVGYEYTCYK